MTTEGPSPATSSGCANTQGESYIKVDNSQIDMVVDILTPGGGPELRKLLSDNGLKIVAIGNENCGEKENKWEGVDDDIQVMEVKPTQRKRVDVAERNRRTWENFREQSKKREDFEKKLEEKEKRQRKLERENALLKNELEKRKVKEERDRQSFERAKNAAKEMTQFFGLGNERGNLMETTCTSTSTSCSVAKEEIGLSATISPAAAATKQLSPKGDLAPMMTPTTDNLSPEHSASLNRPQQQAVRSSWSTSEVFPPPRSPPASSLPNPVEPPPPLPPKPNLEGVRTSKRIATHVTSDQRHGIDLASLQYGCLCGCTFSSAKLLQRHIAYLSESPGSSNSLSPELPPTRKRHIAIIPSERTVRPKSSNPPFLDTRVNRKSSAKYISDASYRCHNLKSLRPTRSPSLTGSQSTQDSGQMDPVPISIVLNQAGNEVGVVDEDEEHLEYGPSEWLTGVFPKSTRYFPQIGDELIYYRDGHQAYLEQVEKERLYYLRSEWKSDIPYIKMPQLKAAEPVRLVSLEFQMVPPVVVAILNLELRTSVENTTGTNFTVTLHDASELADFLVIRQTHNTYVLRKWNAGDRFRKLVSNKMWRLGTVNGLDANKIFPDSLWKGYRVTWDNGDLGSSSPWEMDYVPEEVASKRSQFANGQMIPATDDELLRLAPYVQTYDGITGDQLAKLLQLIEEVISGKGWEISEPFRTPVDRNAVPSYYDQIEYPVNLGMIRTRLKNGFYRRARSIASDFEYLAKNAKKFYPSGSIIVYNAELIRDVGLELIRNPNVPDAVSVCNRLQAERVKKQNGKN